MLGKFVGAFEVWQIVQADGEIGLESKPPPVLGRAEQCLDRVRSVRSRFAFFKGPDSKTPEIQLNC